MPAPLMEGALNIMVRTLQNRHPRLFQNLAQLKATQIDVEPLDLPHRFILSFGNGETSVRLAGDHEPKPDAVVKGTLETLLSLLEGRMDSDTSFFTRELRISGDTSAIVALRNTLDREEIDLFEDFASLTGTFAKPLALAVNALDGFVQRTKEKLASENSSDHEKQVLQTECDQLRAEVKQLKTRLAKQEVRQKRANAAVA